MSDAAKGLTVLSKKQYEEHLPTLRAELIQAQSELRDSGVSVVIIISGVDGAGKGEVVHRLSEWLDPRGIDTQAFWQLSDEEKERPPFWRFWKILPARGRITILVGSWYTEPIVARVYNRMSAQAYDAALRRIVRFEQMLAQDGTLILKVALHLSKKDQRKRLKDLEQNPNTHWRVLPSDWTHHKLYDSFTDAAHRSIEQTSTPIAPWLTIDANDRRYRDFAVGSTLLECLRKRLNHSTPATRVEASARYVGLKKGQASILGTVDLTQTLSGARYRKQLAKYQAKLNRLIWAASERRIASVILFEGWDAAGKGSCIRRITEAMDPRLYRLIPVAAPTDEERVHHYLWRFWRHIPRAGRMTLFDRSWYGRVLVERVERFATRAEWTRAYSEIRDFESQLADHGIVLAKFWIHISKEEQLQRFKRREEVSYKRHKITSEDWRNRRKWPAYETAVNDMVAETSIATSPWTLVAGNDKKFARIQILKSVCQRLEAAL
jgi:AMP-polyphosphate phosphotransferase